MKIEGVVFGHMHEDHRAEMSRVGSLPVRRALVVASGGDLAFALIGAGVEVTAVDSNPAQIALVKEKMARPAESGKLLFCGRVDFVLRLAGPFVGWLLDWPRLRPGGFRRFLAGVLEGLLRRAVSLLHGRGAGVKLDGTTISLMRARLLRAMSETDARSNPWLQAILGNRLGMEPPEVWTAAGIRQWEGEIHRLDLRTGDLLEVLAGVPANSLGLVSVSNLPDLLDEAGWRELLEISRGALASGGILVARSMLRDRLPEPGGEGFEVESPVPQDRSPLCPVVWIGRKN